jgi:hypothetical protein
LDALVLQGLFSHLNSFAKLGHFVVSEPNGFLRENIKSTFIPRSCAA